MLPDLRFLIGAILATAVLGVGALGLVAAVHLSYQAKVGPLETSRILAFAGAADWNQFYHPDGTRRFVLHRADAAEAKAILERFAVPPVVYTTEPAVEQEPVATVAAPAPEEPLASAKVETASVQVGAAEPETAESLAPAPAPLEASADAVEPPASPPAPVAEAEHVASLPVAAADQEPTQVDEPPAQPQAAAVKEDTESTAPEPPRAAPTRAAKAKKARARKARAQARAAVQPPAQNTFPFFSPNGNWPSNSNSTSKGWNNSWPWNAN